jgi:hypothetical protein
LTQERALRQAVSHIHSNSLCHDSEVSCVSAVYTFFFAGVAVGQTNNVCFLRLLCRFRVQKVVEGELSVEHPEERVKLIAF